VSNYVVRKAKVFAKAKVILSTPNLKPVKYLKDTVKLVYEFYGDDMSRCMLGKKICICQRT
jgi:hypothetical protein